MKNSECVSLASKYPHVKAEQDERRQDADGVDERHHDQQHEEAALRWRHLPSKKLNFCYSSGSGGGVGEECSPVETNVLASNPGLD